MVIYPCRKHRSRGKKDLTSKTQSNTLHYISKELTMQAVTALVYHHPDEAQLNSDRATALVSHQGGDQMSPSVEPLNTLY